MADIFNEIDEELRQEKLRKAWDKWGVLLLAVAVAIVLAVAGWRAWQHWRETQARVWGDAFVAATQQAAAGDPKAAEEAWLSLARTSAEGYPVLASLRAAGARAEAGDLPAAIAAFDAVARNGQTPPLTAAIARIRAAYLAVDVEERAGVEARVGTLAAQPGPWRTAAREILALAAWKAGDIEAVKTRVAEIEADPETARDVLDRVSVLSSLVKAQAVPGKAN